MRIISDRSQLNLPNRSITENDNLEQLTNKRQKLNKGQRNVDEFYSSATIDEKTNRAIDNALLKFLVVCGIPFSAIENPFFIEFVKKLRPAYNPPSRQTLSEKTLGHQIAEVTVKQDKIIKSEKNLTLGK